MSINTPEYAEFIARRNVWIECLCGKDLHSVMNQITRMIWNAGAFRVINEARRLAPPAKDGGVQLNGMMHELINHGFFIYQSSAIRRLVDKSPLDGDRGVYSLRGLLDDMSKHAQLITRSHLFEVDGLEYDPEPVQRRLLEHSKEQERAGNTAYFVPIELNWRNIELRHAEIDHLTGVKPEIRSPLDAIRCEILEHFRVRLECACGTISEHVNKFVAHAATPGSRATVDPAAMRVTLAHLWEAHRAICEVANFIDLYLLKRTNHSFLAAPQFDHLEYLDQPLISQEGIEDLWKVWHGYDAETKAWAQFGMAELEAEMKAKDLP